MMQSVMLNTVRITHHAFIQKASSEEKNNTSLLLYIIVELIVACYLVKNKIEMVACYKSLCDTPSVSY